MTLILCLLAATAPVQAGPSMSVSADGTGCTVLVDVGAPSWRNEGDLWIPVIPGFSLDASHEGRPVLPELTFYVPVPPGSSPSLACTVLSTGRTDAPGALMGCPVATGSGLGMEWIPSPLPDVPPGQAAGELRVQRLAGTDVAVVTLRPMDGSDPGRYASLISARVSWDPVPGYRSLDRPLLEALCLPGTVYWPEPRGAPTPPLPSGGSRGRGSPSASPGCTP